jgi:hypothetical protein
MMLQWICHGHRGHELAHCLTGVSPSPRRLQELTMRFQAKLSNLHPDNPLRSLLTHLRQLPSLSANISKALLLPLAKPIPLLLKYHAIANSIPPWEPFTFTDFLNEEKLAYYTSTTSLLPKNVRPSARNTSLVDISLRIRNPMIHSYGLRWRLNRLLANYKCNCGGPLNRGHLSTCFQLDAHPSYATLTQICPLPNPLPTKHYNLVDHALNLCQLHHFLKLLHFITNDDNFNFCFQPP